MPVFESWCISVHDPFHTLSWRKGCASNTGLKLRHKSWLCEQVGKAGGWLEAGH